MSGLRRTLKCSTVVVCFLLKPFVLFPVRFPTPTELHLLRTKANGELLKHAPNACDINHQPLLSWQNFLAFSKKKKGLLVFEKGQLNLCGATVRKIAVSGWRISVSWWNRKLYSRGFSLIQQDSSPVLTYHIGFNLKYPRQLTDSDLNRTVQENSREDD